MNTLKGVLAALRLLAGLALAGTAAASAAAQPAAHPAPQLTARYADPSQPDLSGV